MRKMSKRFRMQIVIATIIAEISKRLVINMVCSRLSNYLFHPTLCKHNYIALLQENTLEVVKITHIYDRSNWRVFSRHKLPLKDNELRTWLSTSSILIFRSTYISILYFTKFGSLNKGNNKAQQTRTEKNKTKQNGIDIRVVLIFIRKNILLVYLTSQPPIWCSFPIDLFLPTLVGIRVYLGYAQRIPLLVNGWP